MNRSRRTWAYLGGGALLLGLAILLYRSQFNTPARTALTSRELAAYGLANFLRTQATPQSVLVIGNPFTQTKGLAPEVYAFDAAGLEGLRRGLHAAAPLDVAYPELRPNARTNPASIPVDPQTTTPLSYLVRPDAFDQLRTRFPGKTIFVSLIGLPVTIAQQPIWTQAATPKFALLLPDWRTFGDRQAVRAAFHSGKILAAVMNKPGAPSDQVKLSQEALREFNNRYLLVTVETIGPAIEQYPQLFP